MQSADYVDPIYDNKDPIAASVKERGNALTNTIRKPDAKADFRYQFKLDG